MNERGKARPLGNGRLDEAAITRSRSGVHCGRNNKIECDKGWGGVPASNHLREDISI